VRSHRGVESTTSRPRETLPRSKERRKLSFAKRDVQARGRSEILKINDRNSKEVLSVVLDCAALRARC
jgi:hypothetical protein